MVAHHLKSIKNKKPGFYENVFVFSSEESELNWKMMKYS